MTEIDIPSRSVTQELAYDPDWLHMQGIDFHPQTLMAYAIAYRPSRVEIFAPDAVAGQPDLLIEENPWYGDDIYNGPT